MIFCGVPCQVNENKERVLPVDGLSVSCRCWHLVAINNEPAEESDRKVRFMQRLPISIHAVHAIAYTSG